MIPCYGLKQQSIMYSNYLFSTNNIKMLLYLEQICVIVSTFLAEWLANLVVKHTVKFYLVFFDCVQCLLTLNLASITLAFRIIGEQKVA